MVCGFVFILFLLTTLLFPFETYSVDCPKDVGELGIADSSAVKPIDAYINLHREAGSRDQGLNDFYDPKFSSKEEENSYWESIFQARDREKNIIAEVASESPYLRTAFDFSGGIIGKVPPTGKYYGGLWGEVFQKSMFKELNRRLGPSGLWFIFRAYSWGHLGYPGMAGPHMSVVIHDRVYEIGRSLVRIKGETKLGTRGPAGPIALSIDDFLLKTQLESKVLKAEPGFFLAERFGGVGAQEVTELAKYYEKQAVRFQEGEKFNYVMDPSLDQNGRNCVTYLTEPILNKTLTRGVDLKRALLLRRYTNSPVSMLYESAGFFVPKLVKPFMFVDSENWRAEINSLISGTEKHGDVVKDSDFDGRWWYPGEKTHIQLQTFFASRLEFYELPRF